MPPLVHTGPLRLPSQWPLGWCLCGASWHTQGRGVSLAPFPAHTGCHPAWDSPSPPIPTTTKGVRGLTCAHTGLQAGPLLTLCLPSPALPPLDRPTSLGPWDGSRRVGRSHCSPQPHSVRSACDTSSGFGLKGPSEGLSTSKGTISPDA